MAAAAGGTASDDWGALHPHLLSLCLHRLLDDGPLTSRQAAQLLCSASPCRHWRATALREVRERE